MSTTAATPQIATFEPVIRVACVVDAPSRVWSAVSARFYRFLENLPEHYDDLDVEMLKRVPVPV